MNHNVTDNGVRTGKPDDLIKFTEEMRDFYVCGGQPQFH
jgi:hypothetical protein